MLVFTGFLNEFKSIGLKLFLEGIYRLFCWFGDGPGYWEFEALCEITDFKMLLYKFDS